MSTSTHRLDMQVRFEGTPLNPDEQQELANAIASVITRYLSSRPQDYAEFCDFGLCQETNITIP